MRARTTSSRSASSIRRWAAARFSSPPATICRTRYEAALVREGGCHPSDIGDPERASIRRTIAERCLYGVDINPMAVQLARLSLWLATLAADRPLTFLDHRLQTGDSLLGAWMDSLASAARRGRAAVASARPRLRPVRRRGCRDTRSATRCRFAFRSNAPPDDTLEHVRAKEHALAALQRRDTGSVTLEAHRRRLVRGWLSHAARACPPRRSSALRITSSGPRSVAGSCGRAISGSRRRYLPASDSCFTGSWNFQRCSSTRRAAAVSPRLRRGHRQPAVGDDSRRRRRVRRAQRTRRGNGAILRFVRERGIYPSSAGHANLYQLFTERAISLLRNGGRLGLVLPSGLATDHGSAALRRRLLRRLRRRRARRPRQPARRFRDPPQRQVSADDGNEGIADADASRAGSARSDP